MFRPQRSHPHQFWLRWCLAAVVAAAVGTDWTAALGSPTVPALLRGPSQPGESGSGRCAECHTFERGMSHPVDIRPTRAPGTLPLEGGLITCTTCHDAPDSHGSPLAGAAAGHVGQRETAGLCAQCHQSAPPRSKAQHGQGGFRAHLMKEMPFKGRAASTGLDQESRSCMTCHDGASASDAGGGSHAKRMRDGEDGADHPVGVLMRATSRTKDGDFRIASPTSLDPRIRLFSGAIGCGSCHSVYSSQSKMLVMSNRGSALCLQCHKQ